MATQHRTTLLPPPPSSSTMPSSSSSSSSSWTRSPLYQLWAVCIGTWACFGCLWTLLLLQLCIRPFSISLYRRWSNRIACSALLDTFALLSACNTTIHITADSDIPSPMSTCIFVCNHVGISQDVDWWCMLLLYRVLGFQGTVKTFCQQQQQQQQRDLSTSISTMSTTKSSKTITISPPPVNLKDHFHPLYNIVSTLTHFVLHTLLEYPVLSSPDQEEQYMQYKAQVSPLISSTNNTPTNNNCTPLHLLLFPEKMSAANTTWLTKSQLCAQREGRPRLQHVLLPHTTAFYATLECVRLNQNDSSHPLVYDVTLAYNTKDTIMTSSTQTHSLVDDGLFISFSTLVRILTGQGIPSNIHVKIKKYNLSMVAQDPSWLDKLFYEKDALLDSFKIHGYFPSTTNKHTTSSRTMTTNNTNNIHPNSIMSTSTTRPWILSSRTWNIENSIISFIRLSVIPCMIPILIFFSFPIVCILIWIYLAQKSYQLLFQSITTTATSSSSSIVATTTTNMNRLDPTHVVGPTTTSSSSATLTSSNITNNYTTGISTTGKMTSTNIMTSYSNKSGDLGTMSSSTKHEVVYDDPRLLDNNNTQEEEDDDEKRRNEASSIIITPMIPPTPFASPTIHISSWIASSSNNNNNNTMNK